jgi:4-diphosphocytidyl-2-C-methyl-D-erythritol kinase
VSAGEGWSAWPAPAKLNLFLRLTGRRPDGSHLLQTVFQLLDWGDTVELRPRSDGRLVRDGGDTASMAEEEDLVLRAARALQAATGTGQGADLRVTKRIPVGGGMGGGSSDAATVLVGLDALWGTGLSGDALADIGLALGADVPVFVRGCNAWAEGVGEVLVPIDLAPAWYLVVDPGVGAPTAALFQSADLTRDAAPATMPDFVSGRPLGNAFEPVLRRLQPAVDAALIALSRFGEARLTGSGSACFLRFDSREAAESVRRQLPGGLRAWTCAGASRSPLLDALARWRGGEAKDAGRDGEV